MIVPGVSSAYGVLHPRLPQRAPLGLFACGANRRLRAKAALVNRKAKAASAAEACAWKPAGRSHIRA